MEPSAVRTRETMTCGAGGAAVALALADFAGLAALDGLREADGVLAP
jgi:hypothetical protein